MCYAIILAILIANIEICTADVSVPTPTLSKGELKVHEFSIPSPRGLIVDRRGELIAFKEAVSLIALHLPSLKTDQDDSPPTDEVLNWIKEIRTFDGLEIVNLRPSEIEDHWKHRKHLPLVITGPNSPNDLVKSLIEELGPLTAEIRHVRRYRGGSADPLQPWAEGKIRRKGEKANS